MTAAHRELLEETGVDRCS
ncbi:hypothetical protein [Rhizocola hellebori]